jgi:hypothetical protein
MAKFKKLLCKVKKPDGRICNAFLGAMEINKETTVRCLCHNHKGPRTRILEFKQSIEGIVSYRVVAPNETIEFEDDNVRLSHAS